jgi:hypothetical protein
MNGALTKALGDGRGDNQLLLPGTETVRAELGFDRSVNPKTDVGFDLSIARTQSSSRTREQYSAAALHLARQLAQHWFVSGGGGVGTSNYASQTLAPTSFTYVGSASVAYQEGVNTMAFTYNRSAGDSYGLNSRTMQTYVGTWSWHNRRRSWSLFANGERQTMGGGSLSGLNVNQFGAGISNALMRQASWSIEYGFVALTNGARDSNGPARSSGVKVTFTWIPVLSETAPQK